MVDGMTLRKIRDDLWETTPFSPFDPLTTHAYLWTPPGAGNVLFYAPGDDTDFDEIESLGGVAHHYLSHRDEAGPALALVADRFGPTLHAATVERDDIAKFAEPDVLHDERTTGPGGVEVVPTPGHSPGSISYVVTGVGGERYLFTGDTVFVDGGGEWRAGLLPFSDRDALVASLDVLATLRPNLVISSAFGARGVSEVDPAEWPDIVTHTLQPA